MSVKVEKLEHNMAKLTVEVAAEKLEAAIEKAYQKEKNKITIPGFRKGKAPRKMIEQMYGAEIFYEDAAICGPLPCKYGTLPYHDNQIVRGNRNKEGTVCVSGCFFGKVDMHE